VSSNIYYNPGYFGFELIAEDDPGEPYQFDTLLLLRRLSDGLLFMVSDSGCSCPVPFEDTTVEDLVPASISVIEEWENSSCSPMSATNIRAKLRELEKQ
jgi:hypothetical protein